jgi:hypothetical protein
VADSVAADVSRRHYRSPEPARACRAGVRREEYGAD